MSDSIWVSLICGTERYSDITWATGYKSPTTSFGPRAGQDMGWDNARNYLYEALTSTDPYERDAKFVRTFRALGMVSHLLQDMAVPAHVRNDMTSHLFNFNFITPSKWFSNPFEKYVASHPDALKKTPVPPALASPTKLTDFWDTNVYNGTNPSAGNSQGLAEYANANYFSDSTIPVNQPSADHTFPYPQTTFNQFICTDKLPNSKKLTKYISRTPCPTDGSPVDHFAAVSLLNPAGTQVNAIKRVWLDNNVHDTYAQEIIPRAVGYSSALLDYFFRGALILEPVPNGVTFNSIKVNAQKVMPSNETAGPGEVALVIRYKTLRERSLTASQSLLDYPPAGQDLGVYAYKVAKLANVDLTNSQELTFDFSADVLPYLFSDMTMQLVFKSKLGNEENAVLVSPLVPIEGIYSDFRLSLPASGVYGKSNDGYGFKELRMLAQTDRPGGISGGYLHLAITSREATNDPFQGMPADTQPTGALAYVTRISEKNGVNVFQQGVPVELVFDLSAVPIPINATDLRLYAVYTSNSTSKVTAVGYRDISEPTPVDVYNNADKICINNKWYNAGSAQAITLSDPGGNGIPDLFDPYAHNMANIFAKDSSTTNPTPASATTYTFSSPSVLYGGNLRRLGYILTDYSFKYSLLEDWLNVSGEDPWIITETADGYTGTAVKNQTDADGTYTYPGMFTIRGSKMWWGAGVVYDNEAYPTGADADTACGWANLP